VKILLDTHILLWTIADDKKLPQRVKELIFDADNKVYYSIASIWEIEIKHSLGKMPISGQALSEYCKESGFEMIPIKEAHIFNLNTLKREDDAPKHSDPFDRIMVSQAKTESIKFITHDTLIPFYNEECIVSV